MLDPSRPLPPHFSSSLELREQYGAARSLVSEVAANLKAGVWRTEIRTGCPHQDNGDVEVHARALVLDQKGDTRAFSEVTVTGDSAGTWKLYYDDGRLRAITFDWKNYPGETATGVALFDASGSLEACSGLPGDSSPIFCEWRGSLADELGREYFSLRPAAAFAECDTPLAASK